MNIYIDLVTGDHHVGAQSVAQKTLVVVRGAWYKFDFSNESMSAGNVLYPWVSDSNTTFRNYNNMFHSGQVDVYAGYWQCPVDAPDILYYNAGSDATNPAYIGGEMKVVDIATYDEDGIYQSGSKLQPDGTLCKYLYFSYNTIRINNLFLHRQTNRSIDATSEVSIAFNDDEDLTISSLDGERTLVSYDIAEVADFKPSSQVRVVNLKSSIHDHRSPDTRINPTVNGREVEMYIDNENGTFFVNYLFVEMFDSNTQRAYGLSELLDDDGFTRLAASQWPADDYIRGSTTDPATFSTDNQPAIVEYNTLHENFTTSKKRFLSFTIPNTDTTQTREIESIEFVNSVQWHSQNVQAFVYCPPCSFSNFTRFQSKYQHTRSFIFSYGIVAYFGIGEVGWTLNNNTLSDACGTFTVTSANPVITIFLGETIQITITEENPRDFFISSDNSLENFDKNTLVTKTTDASNRRVLTFTPNVIGEFAYGNTTEHSVIRVVREESIKFLVKFKTPFSITSANKETIKQDHLGNSGIVADITMTECLSPAQAVSNPSYVVTPSFIIPKYDTDRAYYKYIWLFHRDSNIPVSEINNLKNAYKLATSALLSGNLDIGLNLNMYGSVTGTQTPSDIRRHSFCPYADFSEFCVFENNSHPGIIGGMSLLVRNNVEDDATYDSNGNDRYTIEELLGANDFRKVQIQGCDVHRKQFYVANHCFAEGDVVSVEHTDSHANLIQGNRYSVVNVDNNSFQLVDPQSSPKIPIIPDAGSRPTLRGVQNTDFLKVITGLFHSITNNDSYCFMLATPGSADCIYSRNPSRVLVTLPLTADKANTYAARSYTTVTNPASQFDITTVNGFPAVGGIPQKPLIMKRGSMYSFDYSRLSPANIQPGISKSDVNLQKYHKMTKYDKINKEFSFLCPSDAPNTLHYYTYQDHYDGATLAVTLSTDSGQIDEITVVSPGSGYDPQNLPVVRIVTPGTGENSGFGATAEVTSLDALGGIASVSVLQAGSSYTQETPSFAFIILDTFYFTMAILTTTLGLNADGSPITSNPQMMVDDVPLKTLTVVRGAYYIFDHLIVSESSSTLRIPTWVSDSNTNYRNYHVDFTTIDNHNNIHESVVYIPLDAPDILYYTAGQDPLNPQYIGGEIHVLNALGSPQVGGSISVIDPETQNDEQFPLDRYQAYPRIAPSRRRMFDANTTRYTGNFKILSEYTNNAVNVGYRVSVLSSDSLEPIKENLFTEGSTMNVFLDNLSSFVIKLEMHSNLFEFSEPQSPHTGTAYHKVPAERVDDTNASPSPLAFAVSMYYVTFVDSISTTTDPEVRFTILHRGGN